MDDPTSPQAEAVDALLTVQEAADRLAVSIRTCRTWIEEERIAVVRFSPRAIRVRASELERFIRSCEVSS